MKVKECVKLRSRERSNGTKSLFLDYVVDGVRKSEYLKLYLIPEKTKADKLQNKETIALANAVKAKRLVEIQNGTFGFSSNKEKGKVNLIEWLQQEREYYREKGNRNYSCTIRNVIVIMKKFAGEKAVMKDINRNFCERFLRYLNSYIGKYGKKLSPETVYTYYVVFSILLNKAARNDLIAENPYNKIPSAEKPRRNGAVREYLTLEEVKRLADTECGDWRVKHSFLFCCFTGLRFIDVCSLRWKHIKKVEEGKYQLELVQQKTKEPVYVPLSENAMRWLPEKGINGYDNKVFPFGDRSIVYDYLHKWVKDAGIEKRITFHCSRHTYATLLLNYGADIYTVSKLLGHTSVKTTQIYAEVMNQTKEKAVNLIPELE